MSYSNISNREKTVKTMFSLLEDDSYTIDKTLFYCYYKSTDKMVELGNVLDNYRDYFELYLVDADVPEEMYYQPAMFAEKYYGTADLDFLVLYFAKMVSLFEFRVPKIKVLPKSRILEINKLFTQYKKDVSGSYKNPQIYIENTNI